MVLYLLCIQIYLYNYDVQLAKTYNENDISSNEISNVQQSRPPTDSYILDLMKDVINNSKIRID